VLPGAPITNYNTRYSGITPEMMAPVTRSLADAQRTLFSFMGPDTLLVRTDGVESPSCSCGGFEPWVSTPKLRDAQRTLFSFMGPDTLLVRPFRVLGHCPLPARRAAHPLQFHGPRHPAGEKQVVQHSVLQLKS